MAEDFAIGKALVIPQSVLNNINKLDEKINLIASDSEKMATHFSSAMTRMGGNAGELLAKLTEIQKKINGLDLSKLSNNVSNISGSVTEMEKLADAISKAAQAINKYNSTKGINTSGSNSDEVSKLQKEIEQLKKKTEQLEKYKKKQEEVNREQSQTRTNNKAIDAYNRAMASSEALVTQRINKIAKLRQAEEMLVKTGKDYSANISKIRSEIQRLNTLNQGQVDAYGRVIKSQHNLMNTSDQLARKLALVFSVSQIEGYVNKLVKVRGEFELQNTALASILQNKDQADKLFSQITDLAVKSPFTVKELTTYTKSLAAYQVQYEDLYDTTKMLADVSAGLGVDMQRLILAFGQVKAANFLRGTETRQFTEAGINMLGELAKYYSELEGRIVSVSEVQDRQFKKMISFQDVEQVFKRLTSEGGMFYEMQERQAETIAGQMSNLQDTIDIMLNDIGKANDSTIRSVISTIKSIIENWEIFANAIKTSGVVFALYYSKIMLASVANGSFAKSAIAATAAQNGLVGATGKAITAIKALVASIKSNPFLVIASAVTMLGLELYDNAKKVEDNRKAYDVFTNSVKKTQAEFNNIAQRISGQNQKIKESSEVLSSVEAGTNEYADAESNANKERKKMNALLEELKTKFPEVYESIVQQKNGTVDLTEAQRLLNEELERTTYLSYLSKQTETFWSDGLVENIKDASDAQQQYKLSSEDLSNAYIQMNSRIKEYFATNKYASKDLQNQLDDISKSSISTSEKIEKMYSVVRNVSGVNIGDLRDIIYDYQDEARKARNANKDLENSNSSLSESIKQIANGYKLAFDTASEEGRNSAKAATEEFIRLLDIKNEAVREFVRSQFEITIGVKLDLSNQVKQELGEVEKRVNDYLDENQFNLVGRIGIGESFEKYMKELQDSLKSWQTELNELESATGERVAGGTNKQRIDELKTSIAQATETLKYWGKYQTQTTGGGSSKNPELDKLKEQVAMIEKAAKAYEDYRKLYDEETAQRMVETAFAKPFENLDLNFAMTFDAQGIIEAYRKLAQSVGGDAQEYIEWKIAEGLTDVTTDQRTKEVEEYRKQIDELFASLSNYQELEKLGLNKDLISQLFGINVSSIEDVQKVFERIKTELKKYGNEGGKLISESEKKITDAQQKELQDRMKKYATYLTKQYSEIANIRIKLQKEMYEVDTLDMSDVQKQSIKQRLQDEANKQIQKLTWEDFKASDMYTQMFDDLDKVSTKGLDYMVERLEELKGTLTDLDPTELKEIIKAINDIKEEQLSRNPLEGIGEDVKEALDFAKQRKELEEQITAEYEKQKELREQIPEQEQNVEIARNNYGNVVSVFGTDSVQAKDAKKSLEQQEKILSDMNNDLSESEEKAKNLKKRYDEGAEAAARIAQRTAEFAEKMNIAVQSMSNLVDGMNSLFNMSDGFNDVTSSLMDFGTNIGNTVASAGSAFASFATGNIFGGITSGISAIGGLFSAIGSLFSIGDKKKEREIQRQLELVEDLQRAYEKLEKAIDDAYSIDTYKEANDQAIANLKSQNASLQAAIAAEQDKKKTDDDRIKEWRQQIEDNNEAIEELLKEQFSQVTGGILDDILSAANDFTDAWLESFKEVGDGMDGLEENFQEMLTNMLKQQASMLITNTFLENWKKQLEKYINADDLELTTDEAKKWVDSVESSLPALNEALENYFKAMQDAGLDLSGEGGDTMTGLSKSISSITEDTAEVLASITESIRYFTSDSNTVLHNIYNLMIKPPVENPFLSELKVQSEQLRLLYGLFNGIIKNVSGSGKAMSVRIV